ncbi:basic helix-loop-helix (bHLH) DNA-binding superfamily protein [Arabidopsis thaliana]|uniref:Basic helix-loop-helix (BHLH) DNA-binding superfamily protein n=1 Tax=Arabidopsis thaliana TaxID=3702 RepID=A0A1P8B5D9_ARATH|nr:basic helix-loop-helix (bHLH) DNA-binding superfamily protein [Arabidopsis thaliana]ANM66810.1 basic helix-loop-helix (bHLH) DNA-binding superfamily protein [Arabidopsis thaliana]|eukprot:NP_001328684.1 basic helix-loop-helix (bHLH) DNA-binding superfamily protein [Arabidopsis thaliana]
MTEEFEIAGISTGAWWSSPTNTAAVFSGYSLPCSTEISPDVTNFGWQNFDNKINDHNDGCMNMHNSFFEGLLIDPNDQLLPDPWSKKAESLLDHEIRNHKSSKEQITQDYKNLTSKRSEELEENSDEYSPRLLKRPRLETLSPLPSFKVRKEKLGDRITALQQLVSPFGKTDTASVLNEAVEYIKFLQEQVTVLSNPEQNTIGSVQQQQCSNKKSINTQGEVEEDECSPRRYVDLSSRGLCLMPISASYPVAAAAASAAEMNVHLVSGIFHSL